MSEQSQGTWLTQEAYDRLSTELEHRKTAERKEIAQRVEAARQEGDLRENAGYHAAREEAGLNEARIIQLEETWRTHKSARRPTTARSQPAPSSPRRWPARSRSSPWAVRRSPRTCPMASRSSPPTPHWVRPSWGTVRATPSPTRPPSGPEDQGRDRQGRAGLNPPPPSRAFLAQPHRDSWGCARRPARILRTPRKTTNP